MRLYKKHVKAVIETYENNIAFLNETIDNPNSDPIYKEFTYNDATIVDRIVWLCSLAHLKNKTFDVLRLFGYTISKSVLESYLKSFKK